MEATELELIRTALETLGITLDREQPHISGERFLMQRDKLVLAGEAKGGRVIIKVSRMPDGKSEIKREKAARDLLAKVAFANEAILFPADIYFGDIGEYLFLVTEYISQEKMFVEYSLEEQFFMTLRAFEAQEAFHATTFEHTRTIKNTFPIHHARDYFEQFKGFLDTVLSSGDDAVIAAMTQAYELLTKHKQHIDTYCNHLVHTDFVPHNFRVHKNKLYMLDAAAVEFGNKYEGWARFLNYMTIHNPDLEELLGNYILKNRGADDHLNLRLMRIYKVGYLIEYYVKSLGKTEGDLHELTRKRIAFWHRVLESILEDAPLPREVVEDYKGRRDTLRSDEEKKRLKAIGIS